MCLSMRTAYHRGGCQSKSLPCNARIWKHVTLKYDESVCLMFQEDHDTIRVEAHTLFEPGGILYLEWAIS